MQALKMTLRLVLHGRAPLGRSSLSLVVPTEKVYGNDKNIDRQNKQDARIILENACCEAQSTNALHTIL